MMKFLSIHIIGISLLLGNAYIAHAEVASSTNYQLERDSINNAGLLSTSSSYSLEDTVGESATGRGTSTNYTLQAGYQQTDLSISITSPADITLSPSISSTAGGASTGNAVWTVTTDSPSGYTLSIKSSTNPSMASGSDNFADYTPAGAVPDYSFAIAVGAAEFGFSVEGTDTASTYLDDGVSTCSTGSTNGTGTCWDSVTTSDKTIASRALAAASGVATTVKFQAEAEATASKTVGTYTATLTLTAIAL